MIPDEAKVGHHRAETVPARKCRGGDDEAGKIAACLDLGINRLCQFNEIVFVERRLWSHQQDGMRGIQLVLDHGLLLYDRGGLGLKRRCSLGLWLRNGALCAW